MNGIRRRSALLLEAIVGLTLTAILITGLLGIYRRVHTLKSDERLEAVWAECAFQKRLWDIVPQITSILRLEDGELICLFNNGIDHDPLFCSEVVACLHLDGAGRFVAELWPSPGLWRLADPPCRQLVLASGIKRLDWVCHCDGAMVELCIDDRSLLFPLYASGLCPLYHKAAK